MINESRTPFVDLIYCEYHTYIRRNGRPPLALFICEKPLADMFFSELYEFTMKHKGEHVKFENPDRYRKFLGMDVIVCDWIYGGATQWGFGR